MEENKKKEIENVPVENMENQESSPMKKEEHEEKMDKAQKEQVDEKVVETLEQPSKLEEKEISQKIEDSNVSSHCQEEEHAVEEKMHISQTENKEEEKEPSIVEVCEEKTLEDKENHLNVMNQESSSNSVNEEVAKEEVTNQMADEDQNQTNKKQLPSQTEVVESSNPSAATKENTKEKVKAKKIEVRKTPRPKKILIGAITASMLAAGIIGFGAYVLDPSPIVAMSKQEAVKAKQSKIQLLLDDKTYELDLKTIGYDGENVSTIDEQRLRLWLEEVRKEVEIEPQNAEVKFFGQEIKPEKMGRKMDVEKVESWLNNLEALINKPHTIPIIPIEPEVTTEDLQKVDQALIGKYTTKFDPGNVNRTTNIKLASKAINNLVLLPGEEFSFNKVVGQRTAERGYKPAPVIVKGEYSEGIGGGICQVSSTLYNSVDEAGLKITRRVSHSREVTYVPPGRDATVSWGGPDFRFKNNLDKPVLIRIKVSGPYLTVYTYTVPGAKVKKKKVEPAPQTFTTVEVDPTKPTANLSNEETVSH